MADLESSCVLCFQASNPNKSGSSDFEHHSLRYIFKYLKVNPCATFESRLLNGDDITASMNDFVVTLCAPCSKLITKLTSQIQQLELTQLLIDHQIQQLNLVLEKEEPNRTSLTKTEPDANAEIEKDLRKILAEKCCEQVTKLKEKLPTVQIERVTILAPTCQEYSDNEFDDSYQFSEDFQDNVSDVQSESSASAYQNPEPNIKSLSRIYTQRLYNVCKKFTRYILNNSKVECSICKTTWKEKGGYFHFSIHFVVNHPEKYFNKQKLPDVSDEDYMFYCKYAFNVETSCAKRTKTTDGRLKIGCPHCNILKTFEKQNDLRRHLAIDHYKIMEQKIIALQKSGNISSLAEIELPRVRPTQNKSVCKNWIRLNETCNKLLSPVADKPNKLKCQLCGNFAQAQNPRLHLVTHHPETVFENSIPPSDLTPERFRILCKNFMLVEGSQKERAANNKGISFKCHLCAQSSHNHVLFRYHLASKHFKYLEEKLTKLSKDSMNLLLEKSKRKFCGKDTHYKSEEGVISSLFQLRKKLIKLHCYKYRKMLRCKICREALRYTDVGVEYHFVNHHIQELFLEMQIKSVDKKQFEFCCKRLLEEKREECTDMSGFKCRYCKKCEVDENQFRVHLIVKHFGILEESLVRMQTDQIWKSKEEAVETQAGVSCAKRRKIEDDSVVASETLGETEYIKNEDFSDDHVDIDFEKDEIQEDFDYSYDLQGGIMEDCKR